MNLQINMNVKLILKSLYYLELILCRLQLKYYQMYYIGSAKSYTYCKIKICIYFLTKLEIKFKEIEYLL
jgi:hypothetical protein